MTIVSGWAECDHSDCPAKALVAHVKDDLELTFCQHHSNDLDQDLSHRGWECVEAPTEVLREAKTPSNQPQNR